MFQASNFKCENCLQTYSTKFSLRRHLKVKHPPKVSSISCETCGKTFASAELLNKHVEIHDRVKNRLKCPLCDYISHVSFKLNEHIKNNHGINIEVETQQFNTVDEFLEWKIDIEKNDTSKFVKYCGNSKIKDGSVRSYYYCHRSYVYKPYVVNRIKKLKKQGLAKISAHCPASMKVINKENGAIEVHYVKTHIGHEREIRYINLSTNERKYLATMISKSMTFDQILLDIQKESNINNKFSKLNFVTKADLHNIRKSFNLYNDVSSSLRDDLSEVDCWVREQQTANSSAILFYKPKGVVANNDGKMLKLNDYFLAIMTKYQEAVLVQQHFTCVCLDIVHSTNVKDIRFELVTISVLNNSAQLYPCAFLITSRADLTCLEIFLILLKNKVGNLSTNIFLSNMNDSCYEGWCNVMQAPQVRLYSSWHLNRIWCQAMQKFVSRESEHLAYNAIKELMSEKDKNKFHDRLKSCLETLCSNSKTSKFGEHFKKMFAFHPENWANCYRKNFGLETDLQFERIHRSMRYLFISMKTYKRLDKSLIEINKFVQEFFYCKYKLPPKELKITKMREVDSRHKASLRLNVDSVVAEEMGWKVSCSKLNSVPNQFVREIMPNCDCSLFCDLCKVCIHRFCCSCNDSSVMWRMCKHIHLVCRAVDVFHKEKELVSRDEHVVTFNEKEKDSVSCERLVDQLFEVDGNSSELNGFVECLNVSNINPSTPADLSLEGKKKKFIKKFATLIEMIKSDNDASIVQNSLDLLSTALNDKNNPSLENICTSNEIINETFPAVPPPLVSIRSTGPKLHTIPLNSSLTAQSQNNSRNISHWNEYPPPLVPLKRKSLPPEVLVNMKEDLTPPLTFQIVGVKQDNAEEGAVKSGNLLLLMNKFLDNENN